MVGDAGEDIPRLGLETEAELTPSHPARTPVEPVAAEPLDGRIDVRPKEESMTTLSSARPVGRAKAPRGTGRTVWQSARAAIRDLLAAIAKEHEIRRSLQELVSRDERMLRDIGLTRGDIERAVRFGRA